MGPGEAHDLLPWDGAEMASILAGEASAGPIGDALGGAEAVVAWTRSREVAAALARRASRVHAFDPAPPAEGPHASAWLVRALVPLGIDDPGPPPAMAFTAAERAEASRRVRDLPPDFLAVHPGSGSPSKNWPLERFVTAARRLSGDRPWLLVLGPAEEGLDPPAGAVVARRWPVRVLGAALASARLFLGNDSGASHLAAAAGVPTLALFGPTDPGLWAPVGPCVRVRRPASGDLDDLGVAEVVAAASAITSAASGPPSG